MRFGLRELIFLVVLLAVPVASFVYVFKPRNDDIRDAKNEIRAKQTKLDQLEEITARIDDIGLAIELGEETINDMEQRIPSRGDVESILEQVWQIAQANRLTVKSVRSEDPIEASLYMELPLKVIIEGSFDGFYEFLLELEALPRITRIHKMRLARLQPTAGPTSDDVVPGAMRAEFTLSIYFE